jgi:protein TonB
MAAIGQALSRHGALIASLLVHGAALAMLMVKLSAPTLTAPANAETPAVVIEIVTAPTPTPDLVTTAAPPAPPPEPPPEAIEEPPPLIESMVAEEVAPPPPPPKIEKKPEPKPKPVKHQPRPEPVEIPVTPVEMTQTAVPTKPSPAPPARHAALAAPSGRAGPPPDYLALLHLALEKHKEYPRAARQRRQQGRAMLRFAIDRGGNVLDYCIEKSSGYDTLDREVVAMIQRASPLPPMPPEMATDRLEVVVPVPFVLR